MFSIRSRTVDNGKDDSSSSSSKTVTSDCCDYERLEDENCDQHHQYQHHQRLLIMPMFTKFKGCSLFLGLLVGFFIQFSTLGANFLLLTLWGQDVINTSKKEVIVFSLLWSFFTSFMAIVVLGFLRALVSMVFRGSNPNKEHDDEKDKHSSQTQEQQEQEQEQHDNDESILEELVLHMECRFVVGALIGVCFAWTMTDVLLGMKAQIIYSIMTLIIALLWCKVMMWCFTRHDGDYVHIEDEQLQDKDHQKTSSSSLLLSV